jgi:tRNA (cmo5U34)-methyltransferase
MQDQVMPAGKWEFDSEVTGVFDDMLARSIPQYDIMRKACFDLASKYVQPKTDIVDLGCSRGAALAPLIDRFGAHNHYIGVEVSEPMLDAVKGRFKGLIDVGMVDILNCDLRKRYPTARSSVTLCVLTLQFTPIEYRQRILRDIYQSTISGGVLILVEKVLGASSAIDADMVSLYYDLKAHNGYSQDQIERKRLSLEGVLVPVTAKWNEELLRETGFLHVDCFWRWMNFAGWIAIKE